MDREPFDTDQDDGYCEQAPDGRHAPDSLPGPLDYCKHCGLQITWMGENDWELAVGAQTREQDEADEANSFTRDQVSTAVNTGADLVRDSIDCGDRDHDLINLIVNAVMTVLDHPNSGFELDDVIRENYDAEPAEVRSWVE